MSEPLAQSPLGLLPSRGQPGCVVPERSTGQKVWSAEGSWAASEGTRRQGSPPQVCAAVAASRECLPRSTLHQPDFSPLRRNGTHGSGPRLALEARPEAEEELLLRAVAVGPHCLQELSGIRRGRAGLLFHWDSSRVPAAAAVVGCRVSLCPPRTSLPHFSPPSVSWWIPLPQARVP